MIEISYAAGMYTVLIGWILFRGLAWLKNKKVDWRFEAKQIFFLINLLVIARFVFYPFSKVDGKVQPLLFDPATAFPFRMNLVPIVNLLQYDTRFDLVLNLVGNVCMFIPTGIMTPMIYRRIQGMKKVVLTGALISLAIEVIQLPFSVRASDVDDLILNTLGCLIGYGIYALVCAIRNKVRKTAS